VTVLQIVLEESSGKWVSRWAGVMDDLAADAVTEEARFGSQFLINERPPRCVLKVLPAMAVSNRCDTLSFKLEQTGVRQEDANHAQTAFV
jgi:hypothetical protein